MGDVLVAFAVGRDVHLRREEEKADERNEREEYEKKLEELSKRYGIPKEKILEKWHYLEFTMEDKHIVAITFCRDWKRTKFEFFQV
ncbi:hypothetical protein [Thermococcus gammatolerans]|nr:hypothetical protein [Thermococcus gammatolerans]